MYNTNPFLSLSTFSLSLSLLSFRTCSILFHIIYIYRLITVTHSHRKFFTAGGHLYIVRNDSHVHQKEKKISQKDEDECFLCILSSFHFPDCAHVMYNKNALTRLVARSIMDIKRLIVEVFSF